MDVLPNPAETPATAADPHTEFLLKEYERRSAWMQQDEEEGERRATFFVTVVGAAGVVFAFGFDKGHAIYEGWRNSLAVAALAGMLLVLGLLTLRRLLQRHIVTDRHLFAMRDIARMFVTRQEAGSARNAFGEIYKERPTRTLKVMSVGKGGWVESISLVNALLGGILCGALVFWRWREPISSSIVVIVAVAAFWIGQRWYSFRLVTRNLQKTRDYDKAQCGNTA